LELPPLRRKRKAGPIGAFELAERAPGIAFYFGIFALKNSFLWTALAMAAFGAACGGVDESGGPAPRTGSTGSAGAEISGAGVGAVASGGMPGTFGGSPTFGGTNAVAGSVGFGGGGASSGGTFGVSFGGTFAGGAGGVSASGGRAGGPTAGTGGAPVSICTSKKNWTGGNGVDMRPGNDCAGCHSFSIAGTVYPTADEPNNCDGTGSNGLKVLITGANGTTLTLTPSATSGNFYSNTKVQTPYSVKITNSAGASRSMVAHQTAGNCNSCHTPTGANGAPGRIMAP
jgi:hypothetical protein